MSARNGDKARFGRLRRQKILQRKRIREVRDAMDKKAPRSAIVASQNEGANSSTLEPVSSSREGRGSTGETNLATTQVP